MQALGKKLKLQATKENMGPCACGQEALMIKYHKYWCTQSVPEGPERFEEMKAKWLVELYIS